MSFTDLHEAMVVIGYMGLLQFSEFSNLLTNKLVSEEAYVISNFKKSKFIKFRKVYISKEWPYSVLRLDKILIHIYLNLFLNKKGEKLKQKDKSGFFENKIIYLKQLKKCNTKQ